MGKVLSNLKQQNKDIKAALKAQKKEENTAKDAYKEAKVGLFASKDDKLEAARAKRKYEQEKAETAYGKVLQQQSESLTSSVKKEAGFFGLDSNISSISQQEVNQLAAKSSSFISQNKQVSSNKKSLVSNCVNKVTNTLDSVSDKVVSSILDGTTATGSTALSSRGVSDIVTNVKKAVTDNDLSL